MKKIKSMLSKKNFSMFVCLAAFVGFLTVMNQCTKSAKNDTKECPTHILDAQNHVDSIQGLYYLHLDDFSMDQLCEVNNKDANPMAACSEVRRGNYVVRNLDWFQYDQGTIVVRVDETEDRLGSLQVCGMIDSITHNTDITSISTEMALRVLAGAFDGMNTAGVYIGANVVPFRQMSTDGSDGVVDYFPEDKPHATQRFCHMILREVLDHATSLDSAKEIILNNAWKDTPLLTLGGFQVHFLVATEEGTFVCEFVNGKPVFVDAASTETADLGNIMTNFSNYLYANNQKIQSHGAGYERYLLAEKTFPQLNTLDDFKMMGKLLFYSRMYADDYNDPDYFWTEWSGDIEGGAEQLMQWREGNGREGAAWETFLQKYNENHANYDWRTRGYSDKTGTWWFTTHSSIWNIKERKLTLDIEEQNLYKVEFSL